MLDDGPNLVAEHPDASWWISAPGWTTMCRVDPPPTSASYRVELPAVIALQDNMLPGRDQALGRGLAGGPGVAGLDPVRPPTLLVADGLLAFLSEPVIVGLFRRTPTRSAQVSGGSRRLSPHRWPRRLAVKVAPAGSVSDVAGQWAARGLRGALRAEDLESTPEAGQRGLPASRTPPWGAAPARLVSWGCTVVREDLRRWPVEAPILRLPLLVRSVHNGPSVIAGGVVRGDRVRLAWGLAGEHGAAAGWLNHMVPAGSRYTCREVMWTQN